MTFLSICEKALILDASSIEYFLRFLVLSVWVY